MTKLCSFLLIHPWKKKAFCFFQNNDSNANGSKVVSQAPIIHRIVLNKYEKDKTDGIERNCIIMGVGGKKVMRGRPNSVASDLFMLEKRV